MAMFDLKDSDVVKIRECHTNSSTLVKGENLKKLDVADSTAFTQQSAAPVTPNRSLLKFLAENLFIAFLAVIGGLAVAYLVWRFGWS